MAVYRIGESVPREKDKILLRGKGRYVAAGGPLAVV